MDLETARFKKNYRKVLGRFATSVVLILDEWLLLKPTEQEQRDILELLHRRRKRSSTIFCSQYRFEEWYDQLGGDESPLADAIIDRIAHESYMINITSIDPKKEGYINARGIRLRKKTRVNSHGGFRSPDRRFPFYRTRGFLAQE